MNSRRRKSLPMMSHSTVQDAKMKVAFGELPSRIELAIGEKHANHR